MSAKDLGAGLMFLVIGIVYGGIAFVSLPFGTAFDMGPGFFPLVLAALLAAFGIAITVRGLRTGSSVGMGQFPWRGGVAIVTAVILFASLLEEIGLFPAVTMLTFISSLATPRPDLLRIAIISLSIAAFCTVVFRLGIGLPVPAFGAFWGLRG